MQIYENLTLNVKPFGKNQLRILNAIRDGRTLNRFFENGGAVCFLEGVGEVSKDSVRRLIARGVIKELDDAMFGIGMSYDLDPLYSFAPGNRKTGKAD